MTAQGHQATQDLLDDRLGTRSMGRRLTEICYHDLTRHKAEETRLITPLTVRIGEIALARQIAAFEQDLLTQQEQQHISTRSTGNFHREAVEKAFRDRNIPQLVTMLRDAVLRHQARVQERVLHALRALLESPREGSQDQAYFKNCMVNCGVLQGIADCMARHPDSSKIQRHATAILLNLPFFDPRNDIDKSPVNARNERILRDSRQAVDVTMVDLMVQAGCLELMLVAVQTNAYDVHYIVPGDEEGNYERSLANIQIPIVCRGIDVRSSRLLKSFSFLRQCMASLLSDNQMSPKTLASFLHPQMDTK